MTESITRAAERFQRVLQRRSRIGDCVVSVSIAQLPQRILVCVLCRYESALAVQQMQRWRDDVGVHCLRPYGHQAAVFMQLKLDQMRGQYRVDLRPKFFRRGVDDVQPLRAHAGIARHTDCRVFDK
ncbi:hypothetical protein AWB90_18105 [Mycobacterium paraense]|uniref:Uncharacterized protein n=1 Tax=Mycobacterium paraense TaxID=767916 RepID=A0A1X2A767_9MYCO|nr:hypothetical protein AWB90_18105 [Mycobacterium paraense]